MNQPTNRLSTRARVITTLERIQQGQSLASLLDPLLNQINDQDKGFAHELLLGTLRQWWALSRIGESLIDYEVTDKGVWAGLNVGLYQLLYMDTPDYAAIGETVEAIKELDKGYGAGLVNAILRKVQKNPTKFANPTGLPNSSNMTGRSTMQRLVKHCAIQPRFFYALTPSLVPIATTPNY